MRRAPAALVLAMLVLQSSAGVARAQLSPPPDQIEEDWQLVIATPDVDGAGPQVSTSMSPVADGSSAFFVFNLNYRESPSFNPGGMEAQVWSGDQMLSSFTKGTAQCSTANETITWTQRMTLSTGTINFAVDSGKSTTWGKFGQGQQLNLNNSFTTSLTSLSAYSPSTTVAGSGAGWEPNRVSS